MDRLAADIRYAIRLLLKHRLFTAVAVLTLAVGIGANVAIFTLVNAVLLRPLPFHEPDRLVRVYDDLRGAGATNVGLSVPEVEDLRQRSDVFEQVSVILSISTALSGGDQVERIELLATSPNYFELLGAKAVVGRVYGQADWVPGFLDGVVISDGLWKRQFGGDPNVIGKRIRVDEDGYTIIGVMPADFRHPGQTVNGDVDLWAGCGFMADPYPNPPVRAARNVPGALGRLKAGITLEQAQQRLDALTSQLQRSYPKDYPEQLKWTLRLEPAQSSLTGNVRPTLVVLLAAVGVLLLMVCANVATLLIARSSGRTREFAIRQSLGAPRRRLVQQVLIESVIIAIAGGAAAIGALILMRASLIAMMPADLPRLAEVQVDWKIVALAFGLSTLTGVLCGITPAVHASATDSNRDLKEGGPGSGAQSVRHNKMRSALVVVEVALSVMLLIGAGLLIRSFAATLQQDPGLDPKGLTAGQIWIPVPNNPAANPYLRQPQRSVLFRKILAELTKLPDIDKAALGTPNDLPFLSNVRNPLPFSFADEPNARQDDRAVAFGSVTPDYFAVLKTPLRKGRLFTDQDMETVSRVVLVNEAFVRKFSAQKEAIGRHIRNAGGAEMEIVGIVGDVRDNGLDAAPVPRVYQSLFQTSNSTPAVFLRTRSGARVSQDAVARTIHAVDPELPVFNVRTMEEWMSASMTRRRFALSLMSVFAGVALLLATLGIYGVMAFLVSQRIPEFAIRLALGAGPLDILRLAVRPGVILMFVGAVAGLVASLSVTHLMSALLFGISASDPFTFIAAPVLLGIVALAACLIPARAATRVSLIRSLRT
jgi:putative ABC transport system permease protein